ncbi:hypothetical protein CPT75_13980 [Butyrivibrio fibrisolvens]|uniref:Methyltransferase type 11 domain-containing protein n=1 Tax=Butyrivibrio fibrisolvens TaxID=831 RepID=A0A317G6K7_BUTFI|nr:hypothetical protein CPT75_13980 [Butyrivibrio fibrisolvens]
MCLFRLIGGNTVDNKSLWEKSWSKENIDNLLPYLEKYNNLKSDEIDLFQKEKIKKACDAACGFGTYTLALASNGFIVKAFDISENAAEITKEGLKRLGYDIDVKAASILQTGYADSEFDGAFAHSVLDHMTFADAKKGFAELCRIVRSGGLILVSFDEVDDDDLALEHENQEDGCIRFTGDSAKNGMILHPYDDVWVEELLSGKEILYEAVNSKDEHVFIVRN